jgi:outer membrane protein OmpA-like peptidoglycan-associated protein
MTHATQALGSAKRAWLFGLLLVLTAALATGCAGMSRTAKGGLIGAGAGGVMGAAIGSAAGNTAVGAILGAAVGGATGALIGKHMDSQAEKMKKDVKGAKVERVGEGILVTFESGILFDTGKSELKQAAKDNIMNLSKFLQQEPDTKLLIAGHTDNTGTDEINQPLSEARAKAVSDYLMTLGIAPTRVETVGHGSTNPVGDNTTKDGRALNRRVEVAVYASKEMVKKAEGGKL